MLLAETTQQPAQKRPDAPADKNDAAPAKPPVESADAQTNSGQTNASAPATQTTSTAPDDKRDKKNDKDDSDQAKDPDAATAPETPVFAAVIPPASQPNPQAIDIAVTAPGRNPAETGPADSGTPEIDPVAPRAAAQPVNDPVNENVPAPTPATIAAAGDDEAATDTLPPPVIAAVSPNRPDDKHATGKTARPAPGQPQPAGSPAQTPAADAIAVAQAATPAPSSANASGPGAGDTATIVQTARIPAATEKSATGDIAPTDKPPHANTPGEPATVPGPASLPATASPVAVARTEMAKDNGPAKSDSDSKPVHVADGQPDVPAPLPQSMPAPSIPHQAANAFGIAPPITAANNVTVTSSVQITTANAEAAPDLDALAVSVAARAMSGAKQFEIRLDPPELGRVDVRLSIDASGKTQAHMTADQPQTLNLLQKDATSLTQALRDAGLDVSQGGLNFSLRGQDRQSGDGNNGTGQGRRTNLIATRAIQAGQSPSAISFNGAAQDARVDIHV